MEITGIKSSIKALFSNFWKNYINFEEKINRKDYWRTTFLVFTLATLFWIILPPLILLLLIPFLSMTARRLRDIGKSPFWLFIFISLIAITFYGLFPQFILIFWLMKPSLKTGNFL